MKRQGGPIWLRELGIVAVWSAAAVNVFAYTFKDALATYKRPPLTVWKGAAPPSTESSGGKPGKKKKKNLLEKAGEIGEETGETILKGILP